MTSPYKRRRPSIVRNLWVYRRLVVLAMILGLMLWFIAANNTHVTVAFPFGLGSLSSSLGLVILLSALVGAVISPLTIALARTLRRRQLARDDSTEDARVELDSDRPPADYAAKTTEGFSQSNWS